MSKIMGMLPGMGQIRDQLENFDEREIDRIQAIIQSMTPAERANPKIIDGSRRARIAKGSGRQVTDVNSLVDRFFEARKMMMPMAKGGGMPGMPGMPGMAGGGKRGRAKQAAKNKPGKGRRVSGNPAKAAQQAKAAEEKVASGNPFGNPDGEEIDYEKAAAALDLPEGLLQVPQVTSPRRSWSSTARTSWARSPTAGGRTAPVRPGGCTSELMTADVDGDIVLVLEGEAKAGVPAGRDGHVTVVHAPKDGDERDRAAGPPGGGRRSDGSPS